MPNGVAPPIPTPPNGWNRWGTLGDLVFPDIAFWGRFPNGDLTGLILNPIKLSSCHRNFNYLSCRQYDFIPDAFNPAYNYRPIFQSTWDLAFTLVHLIACPGLCPIKTNIQMQYAEWDTTRSWPVPGQPLPPDQVYATIILKYKCVEIKPQQQHQEPTPQPEPKPEKPPPGGIT